MPPWLSYAIFCLSYIFIVSGARTTRCSEHRSIKSQRRSTLSIGVILPDSYRRKVEPSIALALRHVHTERTVLVDHCLELVYKNTECKTSLGMKSLFDLMNTANESESSAIGNVVGRAPVALFGDICTEVNEPVAMASKYWNILHLSFTETHAKFGTADSRELYPTFFRIVPSDRDLNTARCYLIRNFNWNRVGTIKQSDDSSWALSHERLTSKLDNSYNVKVVYTASLSSDQIYNIGAELDELKRKDAHIIIGDFRPALGLSILCEAFSKGMFGTDYLWILPGYHNPNWWRDPTARRATNCSTGQLRRVLDGHFALEFVPLRPFSQQKLVSNRTVDQVLRELRELCAQRGLFSCQDGLEHSAYAYDGIWALALALNDTLKSAGHSGEANSDDAAVFAARLLGSMRAIAFEGLTGRVRFHNNERLGTVRIQQWANGSYSTVGHYDSALDSFHLRKTMTGWTPPLDSTIVVHERQYISFYLLGAMALLSSVGMCLALAFFFVNVKFRNHRFIKMSSPNMNNLIIAGSLCAYIAVFLLGVDTRFVSSNVLELICYAKTWVLSTGFTLAFGSMFAKTWRVHSIFTNIRRDKKAIKDAQLYLIVGGLLLVDAVILTAWAVISPFRFAVTELDQIHSQNLRVIPELERCQSDYSIVFQVVFYVFKGMLMLFGCFLAWETRAVNVPALNDSKYIGMSVYIVVVMCVVGLALTFILQDRLNEAFTLSAFFIVFCTTLTLSLVFMPKVIEIVRTPKGADQQRYRYRKGGLMKSVLDKSSVCESTGLPPKSSISCAAGPTVGSGGGAFSTSEHSRHREGGTVGIGVKYTMAMVQQPSLHLSDDLCKKITQIESDNIRLHQTLVTKSAELWDLLERVRIHSESLKRKAAEVAAAQDEAECDAKLISIASGDDSESKTAAVSRQSPAKNASSNLLNTDYANGTTTDRRRSVAFLFQTVENFLRPRKQSNGL